MHIGVFVDGGQYGSAGFVLSALADAWRRDGHQVFTLTPGPGFAESLKAAVAGRPDLVFAYNGVGGELAIGERSLYATIRARFVAWFVDHPVHHRDRLAQLPTSAVAAFVDPTHAGYLPALDVKASGRLWLPHFGCSADAPATERDVDVLVPGTVRDPAEIRARWRSRDDIGRLCDALVDVAEPQERIVWHEVVAEVRATETVGDMPPAAVHQAVGAADTFVRATRRRAMLAALGAAGVRATIVGQVDGRGDALAGHDVRGQLPFKELLALMARTRVVVDTGAAFPSGSHERGLSAMANGALAVVERNGFWDQFSSEEVQHFSWRALDRVAAQISEVTGAVDPLPAAERGRQTFARSHTAAHRAAAVVECCWG